MKLSVDLIFDALRSEYPQAMLSKARKNDDEMVLSCPYFVHEPVVLRPNQIYVTQPSYIEADESCGGGCLVITPQKDYMPTGEAISVITVSNADVAALYNSVLAVFERYTQWDDMLQELVFSNAPMEEYLKCSFPLINNSMTIHDNDFAYLARVREYAPEGDFIDPELLYQADMQSDQPVFFTRDVIHYRDERIPREYLLLNLFNGNTVAGRLVVLNDHHDFAAHDRALIRHFGRYLEAALTCAALSGTGKDVRRDALVELLSGKQHSEDRMLHLQSVSPWSKLTQDQRIYCLVCTCRDKDMAERYTAYQLERALPGAVSVLFHSEIVVLCGNQPRQTPENFFAQVRSVLERFSVTAGCSDPFTDFLDLIYYYRQACFALSQIESEGQENVLGHFRERTVDYFLRYGCSEMPVRLICAPCVQKLAEHDKTSAVSYCDSLREYLNTGMNSAETARRLNIRRNTFLARLERILRYIDLDLEQEDDRLYLLLSLRMMRT